jgi:SAM-dependent methyltransferase
MLRFVKKNEYWRAEDEGFLGRVDYDPVYWHIKQVQDAIVLKMLGDIAAKSIVEAGGGKSRVLGWLAKANACTNVDELKGKDGGPVRGLDDRNIRHIFGRIGATHNDIPDASQDVVFSISVVEHVPTPQLEGFFDDIARMLRPGGQMIHLIDCYLRAPDEDNSDEAGRYDEYIKVFDRKRFRPYSPPDIIKREAIGFHPRLASNPDRIMNMWNKDNPQMRRLRAEAQGCTWVMRAIRM